jgi:hypothetical protein
VQLVSSHFLPSVLGSSAKYLLESRTRGASLRRSPLRVLCQRGVACKGVRTSGNPLCRVRFST